MLIAMIILLQKSMSQLVFTNFSVFKGYFEFILPNNYLSLTKFIILHFQFPQYFKHDIKIPILLYILYA